MSLFVILHIFKSLLAHTKFIALFLGLLLQNYKTTEIQLTVWFFKQCRVIRSDHCLSRRVLKAELIIRKTCGTWYRQREMTARVCDREHLSVSVRKIMCVCVCQNVLCDAAFPCRHRGPFVRPESECEQDGRHSPQAQISLSYLTQQILCKSSRSVTGKLIISSSPHPILPLAFSPSILNLPLWVWER